MRRAHRFLRAISVQLIASSFVLASLSVAPVLRAQSSPWSHFTLSEGTPVGNAGSPVYDPVSNGLIVFGGSVCATGNPSCYLSDTWVLPSANAVGAVPQQWQQLSPSGTLPPGRTGQSAVYDGINSRMIVFGGGQFGGFVYNVLFNDVWVLSNANGLGATPAWTQLNPAAPNGLPAPREGHRAVYDPNTNRMTIFGGYNNGVMTIPNDVWVLTNANGLGGQPEWIQLLPTGNLPSARGSEIATYDPASNVMTIFGGCCGSKNDVWALSHANGLTGTPAWQQLSPTGTTPAPRESNGAFGYDGDTNSLVLCCGLGYNPGSTVYNDIWILAGANNNSGTPAWVNTIPNGAPFSPPAGDPPGTYDPLSKRLMIFEGYTDLWVLTTRNGIDFSGANSPTPAQLTKLAQAGIQYAVGEVSGRTSPNAAGVAELQAFQSAGFKTAAYSFLGLDKAAAPGDQQVNAGITAMGGVGSSTFNGVSFIAVDVEEESLKDPTTGKPNAAPLLTRLRIIAEALQQITSSGKNAVIYTSQPAWKRITSGAICSQVDSQVVCAAGAPGQVQTFPLWEFTSYNRFRDASGKPHCGDGIPSLTPFTSFDGWSVTLGKQYDSGPSQSFCAGTRLSGLQVDLDVFDPSLFQ